LSTTFRLSISLGLTLCLGCGPTDSGMHVFSHEPGEPDADRVVLTPRNLAVLRKTVRSDKGKAVWAAVSMCKLKARATLRPINDNAVDQSVRAADVNLRRAQQSLPRVLPMFHLPITQ
jgi:hypothetical protein